MKIAVTAQGADLNAAVDSRFGRARYFVVVDTETQKSTAVDNGINLNTAQGAGIQAGRNVVELGIQTVKAGNVGPKAFRVLQADGIKVLLCPDGITVEETVECLKRGDLKQADQANVEGHWA